MALPSAARNGVVIFAGSSVAPSSVMEYVNVPPGCGCSPAGAVVVCATTFAMGPTVCLGVDSAFVVCFWVFDDFTVVLVVAAVDEVVTEATAPVAVVSVVAGTSADPVTVATDVS